MAKKKKPLPAADPSGRADLASGYAQLLDELKGKVRSAQLKAAVSVNVELIRLDWDIGRAIVERQQQEGWGKAVVDCLAADLQIAFPGQAGFSPRNVWRMRAFFLAYPGEAAQVPEERPAPHPSSPILPRAVAEIPWGHNCVILEQVKDAAARLWYAKATKEFGWSRAVLEHQIETDAYRRKGRAVNNFDKALLPRSPTSPARR